MALDKSWRAAFGHSRVEKLQKTVWRGLGQAPPLSSLSFWKQPAMGSLALTRLYKSFLARKKQNRWIGVGCGWGAYLASSNMALCNKYVLLPPHFCWLQTPVVVHNHLSVHALWWMFFNNLFSPPKNHTTQQVQNEGKDDEGVISGCDNLADFFKINILFIKMFLCSFINVSCCFSFWYCSWHVQLISLPKSTHWKCHATWVVEKSDCLCTF